VRVATWNVNSIRARVGRVTGWLAQHSPDVLCMQETKVEDENFPVAEFRKVGYEVALHGERGRNGVAIASRVGLSEVRIGFEGADPEESRRIIGASVGGVSIVTVYVPNGQAVGSEAYFEKIQWMIKVRQHLARFYDKAKPFLICGDFNVAPTDREVWDERLTGGLHCTKAERDALGGILGFGLEDVSSPGEFTWWSYTPSDLKRNRGMRIDLMLVTSVLRARLESVSVDRAERLAKGAEKASDHAPLVVTFKDA
jgi:exodeoxyribonuclease-3